MSYMLKAMWTEKHEEYFDSLDEAVAAGRALQDENDSASVWIEGRGIQVSIVTLNKEVAA